MCKQPNIDISLKHIHSKNRHWKYNIKINITLKYIKLNFMKLRLKSKNFLLKFSITAFLI